jgi:hypothetical protein
MEKEFISYEQSLELASLNFNEKCFGYYGVENRLQLEISSNLEFNLIRRGFVSAPTFSQAVRWFHKNHNLYSWVEKFDILNEYLYVITPHNGETPSFKTPEECETALIDKLIEIVKNKPN